MKDYDNREFALLQKKVGGMLDVILRPGFLEGESIGNNYPSFVFEYQPVFEPFIEKAVKDLKEFLIKRKSDLHVNSIHLFEFAREYLKAAGKWEKSLALEVEKGAEFLFGNLPHTLNGAALADHFLKTALSDSPGIILIHGVGMAYPMIRAHAVLKNLPQRIGSNIPIILFYPGDYDGRFLRPFGCIEEQNEYQAIRWQFS